MAEIDDIRHERDVLKHELIEAMTRCSSEIKSLRATIDRLGPKADAYDNLVIVLGLLPKTSRGYSEDLAWRLDQRIAELKKGEGDAQ